MHSLNKSPGSFPGVIVPANSGSLLTRQAMPDAQLARALEKAANAIVIIDRSSSVVWCNAAYTHMAGKKIEEILKKKPSCLLPTRENGNFINEVWEVVMSGQIWKGELLDRHQNGSTVHLDAVMTPLDDPHGHSAVFMLFLHDITERKIEYDKIWRQANHDRLTGLANRGFFVSMLEHVISVSARNKSCFSLLYIDLDGFKKANDKFGHGVGDEVLIETGEILKNKVRKSDFVARLGGDEFACILSEIKKEEAAGDIASQIIDSLHAMKNINGHKVEIGASIGISHYPKDSEIHSELIKMADAAMYIAKNDGKNCWRSYKKD